MLQRVQMLCPRHTPLCFSSRRFHIPPIHAVILAQVESARYKVANYPHFIAYRNGALNTLGFDMLNKNRGFCNNSNFGSNHNSSKSDISSNSDNSNKNYCDLNNLFCVHLVGMPYSCDDMDIMKFFSPLKPVYCKAVFRKNGRNSGNGIAYFQSNDEAEEAMKRDKSEMGHRYIELYYDNRSTGKSDFGSDNNSNKTYDLNNLFCVHLSGMPYSCNEMDIMKFFSPLKPVRCKILLNKDGLNSGAGFAYFQSHDEAQESMKRNNDYMGSRYIELCYDNMSNS